MKAIRRKKIVKKMDASRRAAASRSLFYDLVTRHVSPARILVVPIVFEIIGYGGTSFVVLTN